MEKKMAEEYLDMNQLRNTTTGHGATSNKKDSQSEATSQSEAMDSGYTKEELKDIKDSLTGLIPNGSKTVRIQNKKQTYVAMITGSHFTYQKKGPSNTSFYKFQFKDGQVFSKSGLLEGQFLDRFYSELDVLANDIEKDQVNYFKV